MPDQKSSNTKPKEAPQSQNVTESQGPKSNVTSVELKKNKSLPKEFGKIKNTLKKQIDDKKSLSLKEESIPALRRKLETIPENEELKIPDPRNTTRKQDTRCAEPSGSLRLHRGTSMPGGIKRGRTRSKRK